jgi:LytS/YehU family sensor histidine kinase
LTKLGVVWLGVTMVYVVLDKLATSFFHSVHLEWHIVLYEYFYALFFVISIPVTIEMLFLIIKKSIEMQDLQAKQHEAEMQLLKSQINPHFLFNTLNSIYSLSLISPEKVPATVLGLGDLMRYMLMESGKSVVFLDQEIAYLSNYINLERIRLEREESIVFEVSGKREGLKIAPMLLLPFIENAFKHSNTTNQSPDILIEILISVQGSELFLYVHNLKRIERAEETDVESTSIGLSNLRRRLHILYPDQHKLGITETPTTYTVNFWLKLY